MVEKEIKATYYIPLVFHPHNFGAQQGSYHLEVFLTLEEMRRYHPEPMQYFALNDTSNEVEKP